MAKIEDDRTEKQRATHRIGIAMTDAFMSGWGGAEGGSSVAVWACDSYRTAATVEQWVRNRGEARRVRQVFLPKYRPGRTVAHVHVYVVDAGHPSLGGA